ncbi:MAG: hypothetical protein Q4A81_04605 [Pasteurellaceae bacterium]|nr:hypothetical protein [Pasteurellaceae bacterium]
MNNETPPKNQEQTAKKIIKSAEKFYSDIIKIKNHRYKSWEHCYQCFHQAIKEGCDDKTIDDLSLQLSFYLASWGMYRGSSFLLQRDY